MRYAALCGIPFRRHADGVFRATGSDSSTVEAGMWKGDTSVWIATVIVAGEGGAVNMHGCWPRATRASTTCLKTVGVSYRHYTAVWCRVQLVGVAHSSTVLLVPS